MPRDRFCKDQTACLRKLYVFIHLRQAFLAFVVVVVFFFKSKALSNFDCND